MLMQITDVQFETSIYYEPANDIYMDVMPQYLLNDWMNGYDRTKCVWLEGLTLCICLLTRVDNIG